MAESDDAPASGWRLDHSRLREAEAFHAEVSREALDEQALSRAERRIAALKLGVTAWVDMSDAHDFWHDCRTLLGFVHDVDDGKLVIRHGPCDGHTAQADVPLVDAAQDLRSTAASYAPELLRQLIDRAQQRVGHDGVNDDECPF